MRRSEAAKWTKEALDGAIALAFARRLPGEQTRIRQLLCNVLRVLLSMRFSSPAAWPAGEADLIRNARPWAKMGGGAAAQQGAAAAGAPDLGPAVVDIRLRAALRGNAAPHHHAAAAK